MNKYIIWQLIKKELRVMDYKRFFIFCGLFIFVTAFYAINIHTNYVTLSIAFSNDENNSSLIGLFTALFYSLFVSYIDTPEEKFVAYSLITYFKKPTILIYPRYILLLIVTILSLSLLYLYFILLGLDISYLVIVNATLIMLSLYTIFYFLMSFSKSSLLVALVGALTVMYYPSFVPLITMFYMTILLFVFSTFYIFINSEKILSKKLSDQELKNDNFLLQYYLIDKCSSVNNYILNVLLKRIKDYQIKSLLLLDIKRINILILQTIFLSLILLLFNSTNIVLLLIQLILFSLVVNKSSEITTADTWLVITKLVSLKKYLIYKYIYIVIVLTLTLLLPSFLITKNLIQATLLIVFFSIFLFFYLSYAFYSHLKKHLL